MVLNVCGDVTDICYGYEKRRMWGSASETGVLIDNSKLVSITIFVYGRV